MEYSIHRDGMEKMATAMNVKSLPFLSGLSKYTKVSPSPSLRSNLSSLPMGVFLGDYATKILTALGPIEINHNFFGIRKPKPIPSEPSIPQITTN